MNAHDDPGRMVSDWLHEYAAHRVPGHLDAVLQETSTRRQRPAWSSLERWLPVQTTARFAPQPRLGWLFLIVLALIAVVGVALLTAGQRSRPAPPFGPAANGAVAYGQDGDIYRYDISTGQRSPLIGGPTYDFGGTFSRDGTRLAFARIPADHVNDADPPLAIMVAGIDGSDIRELTGPVNGNCWSDWSPDGGRIVYRTQTAERLRAAQRPRCRDRGIEHLRRRLVRPMQWHRVASPGRPGDRLPGRRRHRHAVFAIRPDGTGLRQVNTQIPAATATAARR